ncbi:MAG: branched-chain amino acid ABC transporter permease [Chloroflexi bacterium]|jgi:branched-chain amino acid transport system permease protein|nr:branched-chain amino acid ABC transporter permease [Chloroflexota bacterium]
MTISSFFQFVVLGLSLGAMYALISIGYTIIYGIIKLINLAHGDFFMLAGFTAMWAAIAYGVPLALALILGLSFTIAVVLIVNRFIYRPLRAYKMAAFTSTFAVSMVIQASVIIFMTARAKGFPHPAFLDTPIKIGNIVIPMVTPFIIVIALLLFAILTFLVNNTKIGTAMRAVSQDMEMVTLMGVDVERVIAFAFALSVAYAGAGAILWGMRYPAFDPFIGVVTGLKGFIGAVIGGIGSIPGAMVGGFVLGFLEIMLIGFFPEYTNIRDIFSYVLMILFLLLRPGGIFNVKVREEKV